ncbi:uncharacterized protein [Primulina huaijiensis]
MRPSRKRKFSQMGISSNLYQERGAFSVTTSAKLGEDISDLKSSLSKLSCEGTVMFGENVAANAEKSTKSPIEGNADNSRIRHWDKRKILGAVESMDNLYSEGQKLHEQMSKHLSVLHDILSDHKDDSAEQNLSENFCSEQAKRLRGERPLARELKSSILRTIPMGEKAYLIQILTTPMLAGKLLHLA